MKTLRKELRNKRKARNDKAFSNKEQTSL